MAKSGIRHLILILGDQLDQNSAALDGFDPVQDRAFMVEVPAESTRVWSHKARTTLFLSAMRHFAAELRARGIHCEYSQLGKHNHQSLSDAITDALRRHAPQKLVLVEPGEWQIEADLKANCKRQKVLLDIRDDTHFLISRHAFAEWVRKYKQPRMEHFYRKMRRDSGLLMDKDGEPELGRWNFDAENRGSFGKKGPQNLLKPPHFKPDDITQSVMEDVQRHFADNPGDLSAFGWPVTREDALVALHSFIQDRLPKFGEYQDAMWDGEPWLYHALVSAALNLKLLNPREVIAAAMDAYRAGQAPIEAVEGFVRQILGWREFIRGLYWHDMPGMREANHYGHGRKLPAWYWTGKTNMRCMQAAIGQTLKHGYAHHIQRLMVTGQFALLAEISPQAVEDWYLAVYVDAVEWAELPNVAGMALHANGGRFTSKPYIASGAYIKRMSNYCDGCQYRPTEKTGLRACPVTTLYWYFLDKHETSLLANARTTLMARNIGRLSSLERTAIREHAIHILDRMDEC